MNLQTKITGLLAAVFIAVSGAVVSAEAIQNPQTELTFEPRRTADGIDYDVYINNSNYLSTLIFEMNFDTAQSVSMKLTDNECFDISHSEQKNPNSLKGYLGRTGQQTGFSSDDEIKVAEISVPVPITSAGEVTAMVSNAVCAGIYGLESDAVKGNVTVSDTVRYVIKECSILSFNKDSINILSSKSRNADVIYASYDGSGNLINLRKENADLIQGENTVSISGIDFDKSETVSVMVWDSVNSMRPLADKLTINN